MPLQAHAEAGVKPQTRISFTRPSGTPGSLTVASIHLVMTLKAAAVGAQADSLDKCEFA